MSVKELWEEECALCGLYHCQHFICGSCLIGYAVKAGADKEKLLGLLKKEGMDIDDFEVQEAQYIIAEGDK